MATGVDSLLSTLKRISPLVRALDERKGGKCLRIRFHEETDRLFAMEAGRASLTTAEALFVLQVSENKGGQDLPPNNVRLPVAYGMLKRLGVGEKQRRPKPGGDDDASRRELKGSSIAMWGFFCYDV